jgi:hypothetical protein
MRLANVCAICNSTRWCGRPCLNASNTIRNEAEAVTGISECVNKAATDSGLINSNAAYQAKWRVENLELNRQRAREGMRKLRAAKKDNDTA